MAIYGNMVGGGSAPLKTLILTDENGNEVVGVVTESIQMFDATPADVRLNKTFVSDNGIETGENTITYRTDTGYQLILPGASFSINIPYYNQYDYNSLQCIIAPYSVDGVAADKIAINDCVYAVKSTTKIASVAKNANTKSIDLNIINDTDNMYVIYYFTYREE